MKRIAIVLGLIAALASILWPADKKKKKKKQEEVTQTLEVLPEPPGAVSADTEHLLFRVTPLSARGLLSQQVRDALHFLMREHASVVKIRAFVAGTGDTRRVQSIVAETFTERRIELPALSVVQVGSLPLTGAQVVLEATLVEKDVKKPANPHGLAFISAQAGSLAQPLQPLAPLAEKSLSQLRLALAAAGASDVLRATCYLSSLDDLEAVRRRFTADFPQAALNFVQRLREPLESTAACEAVARLSAPPPQPIEFLNPPALAHAEGRSEAVLVNTRRLAITGTQLAFGNTEHDVRLAFQRLGKTLEQVRASYVNLVMASVYTLSPSSAHLVRKVGSEFYSSAHPPASTVLAFEGLPSLDASFAFEVVAALPDSQ